MSRKFTRLLIGIMALGFLTGCQLNNAPTKISENNLIYFKDSRTGLCFAAINSQVYGGYQSTSITNVSCDAIKDLLKQGQ
jgi:hypothetical protein